MYKSSIPSQLKLSVIYLRSSCRHLEYNLQVTWEWKRTGDIAVKITVDPNQNLNVYQAQLPHLRIHTPLKVPFNLRRTFSDMYGLHW